MQMKKIYGYMRIYQNLKKGILQGEYPDQSQIPTEAQLQQIYGVSRITVKKALELLQEEGLIQRFAGRGTFVRYSEGDLEKPSVKERETPVIGVMIPQIYTSFGNGLLTGIAQAANEKGYCLMSGLYYQSLDEENVLIERLIRNGCSGIIAVPFHSNKGANYGIITSALQGYPLVMADRYLDGVSLPYIGSDHEEAAAKATAYLFDQGHRNIGFISSAPTTTAIMDRERGYMRSYAMTSYCIRPETMISDIRSSMPGQYSHETVRQDVERMKRYFADNPDVTALMCIDYNIMRICETAALELGMQIPEDLSLICFDTPEDDHTRQRYTHVQQPEVEIGRTAVDMLVDAIRGNKEPRNVMLTAELYIGESTGKPKEDQNP